MRLQPLLVCHSLASLLLMATLRTCTTAYIRSLMKRMRGTSTPFLIKLLSRLGSKPGVSQPPVAMYQQHDKHPTTGSGFPAVVTHAYQANSIRVSLPRAPIEVPMELVAYVRVVPRRAIVHAAAYAMFLSNSLESYNQPPSFPQASPNLGNIGVHARLHFVICSADTQLIPKQSSRERHPESG